MAVDGFQGTGDAPVFLSQVDCTGSEERLGLCSAAGPTTSCPAAGVTCRRSYSEMAISITQTLNLCYAVCNAQIRRDVGIDQG